MNGNRPATIPTEDTNAESTESMTINVPPELQQQIQNWMDGENYQITISQTGPGQFELVSVDTEGETKDQSMGAGPTDDITPEQNRPGSVGDTGGTTIPSKNPAVVALIMSKRGKKK
jgi:hypothetical protein